MARTLGVILAGGLGRRLGGGPKALAMVAGVSLLDRAIAAARAVCDEVVIAAPSGFELPVPAERRANDVRNGEGPLAGLVAGLAARPHSRALALAVDFPLLESALLECLLERLAGAMAVVPAPGGVPQPLAAAYASGAGAVLEARFAAGERSVTRAVMALDPVILDDDALARLPGGAGQFLNVNTPADRLEAERRIAALAGAAR